MEFRFSLLSLVLLGTNLKELTTAELPHLSLNEFKQQQYANKTMLASVEFEPGIAAQMKQAKCGDIYPSVPIYGWRWFERFHKSQIESALECWNVSEQQAKTRDALFENRRASCLRRLLINRSFIGKQKEFNNTQANDILCHVLTEAVQSKDPRIQFARRVRLCIREMLSKLELNSTIHVEDLRLTCIENQKSTYLKPDIQTDQLNAVFDYGQEMYIKAVRLADSVLAEMNHCLRYFSLVAKEADEFERLEESCKSTLRAKHNLELQDEQTETDICIFSQSVKGRVAREDIEMQFECLNRYLNSSVNSNHSKKILLDLFWNQTQPIHLEQQIACKAASGRPKWTKVFNGWNLTCERLKTLRTKRQAPEVEDVPTMTVDPTEYLQNRAPIPKTEATASERPIATQGTVQSEVNRFQILEELNICIQDQIRSSSARRALEDLEKAHRQWQNRHLQCWDIHKEQSAQQVRDRCVTRQQVRSKVNKPLFFGDRKR